MVPFGRIVASKRRPLYFRLLTVASLRPIAEFGREIITKNTDAKRLRRIRAPRSQLVTLTTIDG